MPLRVVGGTRPRLLHATSYLKPGLRGLYCLWNLHCVAG